MAYWASVRRPLPSAPGRIRSQSEAPVEAHTLIRVRTKASMVTSSVMATSASARENARCASLPFP
eukprot:scaffold2131_cov113-Isochrysis_galbana.AAC.6